MDFLLVTKTTNCEDLLQKVSIYHLNLGRVIRFWSELKHQKVDRAASSVFEPHDESRRLTSWPYEISLGSYVVVCPSQHAIEFHRLSSAWPEIGNRGIQMPNEIITSARYDVEFTSKNMRKCDPSCGVSWLVKISWFVGRFIWWGQNENLINTFYLRPLETPGGFSQSTNILSLNFIATPGISRNRCKT